MNQQLTLTYEEIIEKPLTKWICSILRTYSKKELRTIEIYREIRRRYPDAIEREYKGKLNRRTVLNNLNLLAKYKVIKKRLDKDTSAYWSLGKRALPIEKTLEEMDKRYIDVCGKVGINNLCGGSINIYGFYKPHSDHFNLDSEENITKFNNAVKKLREGMDDIQALIDEGLGYNLAYDVFIKYLKNKKYSVLDRQLLLILHLYCYQPVKLGEHSLLEKWLDFKDDRFIIARPDKKLVETFKKLFYPSKGYQKIESLLRGHKLSKDLSTALLQTGILHLLKMESHVVAVVHSHSGYYRRIPNIKSKIQKQQKSLKFSDITSELQSFSSDAKEAYNSYWKDYFESQNRYIEQLLEEAKKQKLPKIKKIGDLLKETKQKETPDITDLLNIYKELMVATGLL